jgi:hypothetical protein
MGPDTQKNMKAVDSKADAANEAVSLLRDEVDKLKKLFTQHVTAHDRAEAARRATYESNMKKED